MEERKLVVIGAGSAYAPEIFNGIVSRNAQLGITEIVLVDIHEGEKRAQLIADFGKRMFEAAGETCRLSLSYNRREALKGASFVISQIRVGGWQARVCDEKGPMALGLVGQETTGAGGFMNAMRTIPVALEIARDMEEICPEAWLVNFTNPSGIVTEALLKHSRVKCIGLCNVPINMQADAAKLLDLPFEDVRCTTLGLNHLSYVTSVMAGGQEQLPHLVKAVNGNETLMKNIPKVEGTGELVQAIGVLPSPYLQYYYFEKEMLVKQQKELAESGKTRGALAHDIDEVMFAQYANPALTSPPPQLAERGGSLYSTAALDIIEALASDEGREMAVNVQNCGAISGLEADDVVEMNCRISRNGVARLVLGPLPQPAKGLVQEIKHYERLTVEAAVKASRSLALQALLNHPLIHGYNNAVKVIHYMEKEHLCPVTLR